MRYVRNCSWTTIQLFKKFFSLLWCIRIDSFLFFTLRCSHSCLIHRHIISFGRSTRIRTLDPLVPNQVRYQTALHSANYSTNVETIKNSLYKIIQYHIYYELRHCKCYSSLIVIGHEYFSYKNSKYHSKQSVHNSLD